MPTTIEMGGISGSCIFENIPKYPLMFIQYLKNL